MPEKRTKIVVVAGPTASGKTSVGIRLARMFDGEIVSADSIQIYRGMDVGSAKPTLEEQALARHHMIDIRNPDEDFSAGDYTREAREVISDIAGRARSTLVVGGTGLYIRCLLGGIMDLPESSPELRQRLMEEETQAGGGTLFARLEAVDPRSAKRVGPENIGRVVRALEIYELTGKPMSKLLSEHSFRDRPYETLFICLCPERSRLYERIDNRVESMIKGGLLEEAVELRERGYSWELKSMGSLGYRHAIMLLSGNTDRDEAVRLMKRDTRRYAKRQLTWFRAEPEVLWYDPEDMDAMDGICLNVANFLEG